MWIILYLIIQSFTKPTAKSTAGSYQKSLKDELKKITIKNAQHRIVIKLDERKNKINIFILNYSHNFALKQTIFRYITQIDHTVSENFFANLFNQELSVIGITWVVLEFRIHRTRVVSIISQKQFSSLVQYFHNTYQTTICI